MKLATQTLPRTEGMKRKLPKFINGLAPLAAPGNEDLMEQHLWSAIFTEAVDKMGDPCQVHAQP